MPKPPVKKRNLPVLRVAKSSLLPDNKLWTNRFEVRSATSNRVYIVSQNKKKRFWGCSCQGWIRWRRCKHLKALGLPEACKPHEVSFPGKSQGRLSQGSKKAKRKPGRKPTHHHTRALQGIEQALDIVTDESENTSLDSAARARAKKAFSHLKKAQRALTPRKRRRQKRR
jgi:hypothetical protein